MPHKLTEEELLAIRQEAEKVMGKWGYWVQFMNNPHWMVKPSERHIYYDANCECEHCRKQKKGQG